MRGALLCDRIIVRTGRLIIQTKLLTNQDLREFSNSSAKGLGYFFSASALMILAVTKMIFPLLEGMNLCPLRSYTGIPCLSCGATRSAVLIGEFELFEGLKMNPLFTLLVIAGVLWGMFSLLMTLLNIDGKFDRLVLSREKSRLIILSLLVSNWIYLIMRSGSWT